MKHPPADQGEAFRALASQLASTRKALLSVARTMQRPNDAEGMEAVVRSQLEWAASHLFAAVRELARNVPGTAEPQPPLPDTAGPMEELKGHTQAISIPELIGFVSSLRKSGVLTVNSRDESFLIQLEEGAIVYAQGDAPPDGLLLGDILIEQGALTRAELEAQLDDERPATEVLGRALLKRGVISKEQLGIALSYQVQQVFQRMYAAHDAVFQFDETVQMLSGGDIRLNVASLQLESELPTEPRS